MKKSIPPIEAFENVSRRYDGPIPKDQLTKLESVNSSSANMRKATADLRFWKNYIKGGIAAYRSAATPMRREQIKKDVRTAWPRYRTAFRARNGSLRKSKLL